MELGSAGRSACLVDSQEPSVGKNNPVRGHILRRDGGVRRKDSMERHRCEARQDRQHSCQDGGEDEARPTRCRGQSHESQVASHNLRHESWGDEDCWKDGQGSCQEERDHRSQVARVASYKQQVAVHTSHVTSDKPAILFLLQHHSRRGTGDSRALRFDSVEAQGAVCLAERGVPQTGRNL